MPRPHVAVMMAMSADGKIASHAREAARFTSLADLTRLERAVASHDALVMGSGTLRAYGTTFPIRDSDLLKARAEAGQPPQPISVIVTRSLNIPTDLKFFTTEDVPRLLITTDRAASERAKQYHGRAEVVSLGNDVNPEAVLEFLHTRGVKRVLGLGGGAFNFAMFEKGLVDEYYLTVAPVIIGGSSAPTPVDGEGFSGDKLRSLTLLDWQMEGQELFLHYKVHS